MLEERKGKEQKIGRASEFGRVTAAGDVERLHPAIYFPSSFSAAAIVRAAEFVFEQYDFLRSYIHERFYRDRAVLEQYFAFFFLVFIYLFYLFGYYQQISKTRNVITSSTVA